MDEELYQEKNLEEQWDEEEDNEEEPVFYEESGGVTRGEHSYGIVSYPGFVLIFFDGDNEHPMQIKKREFMPLKGIMSDVNFYVSHGDFESAADCVIEALELNAGTDENWEIYCTAGGVLEATGHGAGGRYVYGGVPVQRL